MRRAAITVAMTCAVACTTNDGSLQIFGALLVSSDCAYDPAGNVFLPSTTYDPRGFAGVAPREFVLGLGVRNTLETPPDNNSAGGPNANDAQIISLDVCWFPAHPSSDGEPEFESYTDGVPDNLTCGKLPERQKKTVTSSAPVPASASAAVTVELFEQSVLQDLYGTEFEPWNIPDEGPVRLVQGDVVAWKYSLAASDPSDLGGRDPAWGNFPGQESARVIVQVRANAVLLSGSSIQSNWFIFPVDICVGCLAVACGLQDMTECVPGDTCGDGNSCPPAGDCGNGVYCADGSCPDGTACPTPACAGGGACQSGTWSLEGNLPDPLTDGACLPFQDNGPPCVAAPGCGGT